MTVEPNWNKDMTSDHNTGTVTSMGWSYNGSRICCTFDSGTVLYYCDYNAGFTLVGSVEGGVIWSKSIETPITAGTWCVTVYV